MKLIQLVCILCVSISVCSCVTWVREEKNDKITQGMVGAIIETKQASRICTKSDIKIDELTPGYGIIPDYQKNLAENTYVIERCPAGTRGRVIRFIKERDASQHIWNYVEFEMDDPRLKQKYRIIRMMGLRGNGRGTPWEKGGDFRVVRKME
jgi:uncharacterized Fe-S cluster protein YjdI